MQRCVNWFKPLIVLLALFAALWAGVSFVASCSGSTLQDLGVDVPDTDGDGWNDVDDAYPDDPERH